MLVPPSSGGRLIDGLIELFSVLFSVLDEIDFLLVFHASHSIRLTYLHNDFHIVLLQ